MIDMSSLLLDQPFSTACAVLVLLLLVSIVAREIARDRGADGQSRAARRLTSAVRVLAPIAIGLMCLQLLIILN